MTRAARTASLRKLFRLVASMRRRVAAGVLLILLSSGLTLVYPLVIARMVDGAMQRGGLAAILWLGGLLLALFLGRSTAAFFGGFMLESSGEAIVTTLRKRLFASLIGRSLGFHSRQRVGDLASRLHADTATIREAVTQSIVSALNQAFIFIGALVVMTTVNWRLTAVVLVVSPFAAFVSSRFGPRLEDASRVVRNHSAEALAIASESFLGIQTVHVLNREESEGLRYRKAIDAAYDASVRTVRLSSLLGGMLSFLSSLVTVAVFVYGGIQITEGALTAGSLVAFLFYSESITQSVSVFSVIYANILSALGSSSRVFELLDEASPQAVAGLGEGPRGTVQQAHETPWLAVEDLSFSYDGEDDVITGVSFRVSRGEVVGLVGRSGCGKSTIASLLCRLHEAERGTIIMGGRDIAATDVEELRRGMTLVTQDTFLFNDTILENVRLGRPSATDREVSEAVTFACLTDLAASLPQGLDTRVGERGALLSGGQKQRIAIARAMLRNPSLLVLDEATSALDASTEATIMSNLVARCRSQGLCAIIVTHRQSVMELVDRLVVMVNGHVAEQGGFHELLARRGSLADLLGQSVSHRADASPGLHELVREAR